MNFGKIDTPVSHIVHVATLRQPGRLWPSRGLPTALDNPKEGKRNENIHLATMSFNERWAGLVEVVEGK